MDPYQHTKCFQRTEQIFRYLLSTRGENNQRYSKPACGALGEMSWNGALRNVGDLARWGFVEDWESFGYIDNVARDEALGDLVRCGSLGFWLGTGHCGSG